MSLDVKDEYIQMRKRRATEIISYFYWSIFKQNTFWAIILLIPASIIFTYLIYGYLASGVVTRWEMRQILPIFCFTLLPAMIALNLILYHHAYNLILNLEDNFSIPYKIGYDFASYAKEATIIFVKTSIVVLLPVALFIELLAYVGFSSWIVAFLLPTFMYEIATNTYGLRGVAHASDGTFPPRDWDLKASLNFFLKNKKQVVSYAVLSTIATMIAFGVLLIFQQLAPLISMVYAVFSSSLLIALRATFHAKLLDGASS